MKPISSDVVDSTLASTLDVLDDAKNYLAWIVELAEPNLDGPILEVGAGHGTFTRELGRFGPVTAVEPSVHASSLLRKRFAEVENVTVMAGTVADVTDAEGFGSAVMINVLEHIDDDLGVLEQIRSRLRPDGRLVIWVPAFRLLYSDFDRELGHHRRYRRAELEQLVADAGFDVLESRYVNLPGWFSWLLITRIFKRRPTAGPLVSLFDRVVVPMVRAVESRFVPPFGQSVFLVGRKRLDL